LTYIKRKLRNNSKNYKSWRKWCKI
jgi:hypothetical protein